MKKDADFEISVCDGRGETHDVSNYFPVWLPVIGYDCKNIYLDGVSSFFILWAFLWFFLLHQIASNNSIHLAFKCVTYSFILANLLQSLSVQRAYLIRVFHSTAYSESKCQIHYQFICFALLNWAIAAEATRLKFIWNLWHESFHVQVIKWCGRRPQQETKTI